MSEHRPCERCGAGESEFSDQYPPMCGETHLAHGIVAWICFDCRRNWQRTILDNPLTFDYARLELEFDFWQWKAKKTPTDDVLAYGKGLLEQMTKIESDVNHHAIDWLQPKFHSD